MKESKMVIRLSSFFLFLILSNIVIVNTIFPWKGLNMEGTFSSKGSSPPSGPSQGCSDPPCGAQHVRAIKNIHFDVFPNGSTPPSGPSHHCSDPPCEVN